MDKKLEKTPSLEEVLSCCLNCPSQDNGDKRVAV
jgi:hypothetical protein